MTMDDIDAVADILLRELEAVKDSPDAPIRRHVLVHFVLEGVHLQTLADMRCTPPG